MGGSAFNEDGLYTPRMPTVVYYHVSTQIQTVLKPHFKHVGTAIQGPSKTTHGDVDILVADPVDRSGPVRGDFLAEVVGAKRWKTMRGASILHFAVPWPQEFETEVGPSEMETAGGRSEMETAGSSVEGDDRQGTVSVAKAEEVVQESDALRSEPQGANVQSVSSEVTDVAAAEKYIQVDIQICPTAAAWEWQLFYQAHGDLWPMLGLVLRLFGLTCTYNGLHLRIQEVEAHNKVQSRVKMTEDPSRVLEYLGLDIERYWAPFDSWDDMMAYVGSCRFHNPGRWKGMPKMQEEDQGQDHDDDSDDKGPAEKDHTQNDNGQAEEATHGTTTKEKDTPGNLKHNDRARAEKRPAMAYWFHMYLPRHVDDEPGKDALMSREEVIQDAKEFFGAEFAAKFDEKKKKWLRLMAVEKLWSDIRKILPSEEGRQIGYIMKGLKREVAGKREEREEFQDSDEAPADVRVAYQEGSFEVVFAWAKENWKEVGERQRRFEMVNKDERVEGGKRSEKKGEGGSGAVVVESLLEN